MTSLSLRASALHALLADLAHAAFTMEPILWHCRRKKIPIYIMISFEITMLPEHHRSSQLGHYGSRLHDLLGCQPHIGVWG